MSDGRAINVTNCTIYVGHVRIVLEPCPNADGAAGGVIVETHAIEDQEDLATDTPAKQKDIVSDCSTKHLGDQRQSNLAQCAARPKPVTPTNYPRSSPAASKRPPCYLHGGGRCSNYGEWSGAGTNDDCDDAAAGRNRKPPVGRNGGRSLIWGTRNGGQLSPLRFRVRDQSVARSARPKTLSGLPVPGPSRPEPPVRQDRPVDLYAGSRLPVPIRSGLAPVRIPRIDRTSDARPSPSLDDDRDGCPRYTVDADPAGVTACDLSQPRDTVNGDTDDRLHDTDNNDSGGVDDDTLAGVPGQPSACADESAASATLEKWLPPALDGFSWTGSQQPIVTSLDDKRCGSLEGFRSGDHGCLTDASDLSRSAESCVDPSGTGQSDQTT